MEVRKWKRSRRNACHGQVSKHDLHTAINPPVAIRHLSDWCCLPNKRDNGPEFRSKALLRWSYEWNVEHHFIQPAKPSQNGFVEGFNSTLRDWCY